MMLRESHAKSVELDKKLSSTLAELAELKKQALHAEELKYQTDMQRLGPFFGRS